MCKVLRKSGCTAVTWGIPTSSMTSVHNLKGREMRLNRAKSFGNISEFTYFSAAQY